MNVLMLPYYGDDNPYLRLLSSSLEEVGVSVRLAGMGGRRPLATAVSEHGTPDLVHLHWQHRFFVPKGEGPASAALRTMLFFRDLTRLSRQGVRIVWTVHNVVNHERTYERWERWACRRLARRVHGVVAHCDEARRIVAQAYGIDQGRITVIEHGHYRDWYPEGPPRERARRDLGLPREGLIYLHFGQIRPYKGIEDLLEAFVGLSSEDVRLVLVGRARSDALRELILETTRRDRRITAELEHVDDDRLVRYLRAADAVVLPYQHSLTSGSAVLAASQGRPVVAPRVGCLSELPEESGVFYDQREQESLRDALVSAMAAPLDDMGTRAREHIEGFDWQDVGQRTASLYRSLCPELRTDSDPALTATTSKAAGEAGA